MTALVGKRRGPAPLSVQITEAEYRLLERRRMIKARTYELGKSIRAQLASPTVLLGALGLGFAAERFSMRRSASSGKTARPHRGLMQNLLKLFSYAQTASRLFSMHG